MKLVRELKKGETMELKKKINKIKHSIIEGFVSEISKRGYVKIDRIQKPYEHLTAETY